MHAVKWEEMFPDELLAAIGEYPACYVAYGLAEPHGAYNALGLDWLKAYALCEQAARAHATCPCCAACGRRHRICGTARSRACGR